MPPPPIAPFIERWSYNSCARYCALKPDLTNAEDFHAVHVDFQHSIYYSSIYVSTQVETWFLRKKKKKEFSNTWTPSSENILLSITDKPRHHMLRNAVSL